MKKIFWISIFLLNLISPQKSFGQFLDPCKCLLETPKNPFEQYFTFCRLKTDTSNIVYQVKEVILIDTNFSDYVYNEAKGKHESTIISIDTFNAFLIDGIYREYYNTDTLKTEGILTTRVDIDKKIRDTINITLFGNESYGGYWGVKDSKIEDLVYDKIFKIGEWKYYYPNGILKEEGEYKVIKSIRLLYSNEECKGGPHVNLGYGTDNGKEGIWKLYNIKGLLEKKYVEVIDEDYSEYKKTDVLRMNKRREIIIPFFRY